MECLKIVSICFDIEEPDVKKRELKAFTEANEELNCDDLLVISWDYEKEERIKDKKIKFIPLWRWLLDPLKKIDI